MIALRLSAAGIAALLALAPAGAPAQVMPGGNIAGPLAGQPGSGSLFPTPIPPQTGFRGSGHGSRGGFHQGFNHGFGTGAVFYEEPYVVQDVVVVHDTPAAQPTVAEPPPPPRERYVLGKSYDSLPGGCMKMIEGGASYFYCSGDWYREVGRSLYKAVEQP